jgi:hypothetical protein
MTSDFSDKNKNASTGRSAKPRERGAWRERFAMLGDQGQDWLFATESPRDTRISQFLDPPLEITLAMLHGIRMVDETVVVHDTGRLTTEIGKGRRP